MKNGNLLLLALLILMSNLSLSAQEVYYPGFIVLKNDKKLDGLITEKQNDINFNIVYKDVATGEEIVYTAAEVAYFYYSAGEKYITAPITLNDKVHFVFLKQLVGGEISLYSYVDQLSKEHFYMLNADNLLRDLKFSTVPYQYSKVDMVRPKPFI